MSISILLACLSVKLVVSKIVLCTIMTKIPVKLECVRCSWWRLKMMAIKVRIWILFRWRHSVIMFWLLTKHKRRFAILSTCILHRRFGFSIICFSLWRVGRNRAWIWMIAAHLIPAKFKKMACVFHHLYYNYEKYPLSPLKPMSMAVIE